MVGTTTQDNELSSGRFIDILHKRQRGSKTTLDNNQPSNGHSNSHHASLDLGGITSVVLCESVLLSGCIIAKPRISVATSAVPAVVGVAPVIDDIVSTSSATIVTRDSLDNIGWLRATAAGSSRLRGFLVQISSRSEEGLQNVWLVRNDNGALKSRLVTIDVGLASLLLSTCRWVVALNLELLNGGIVVSSLLDIRGIPVNEASSPFDSTFGVCCEASGPEGELYTGRSLRKIVVLSLIVPGVLLVLCTEDLAVNMPCN